MGDSKNNLFDLSNWKIGYPEAMLSELERRISTQQEDTQKNTSNWINDGSISPLDLYVYLKARFGKPNGMAMQYRHPTSSNIIQWNYTLICYNTSIDIFGFSSHLEIMIYGMILTKSDWKNLIEGIKADFAKYGSSMSEIRKSMEKWILFINPYKRLDMIIERLMKRITSLNMNIPEPIIEIELQRKTENKKRIGIVLNELANTYKEAQTLGTSIRMIAPVLGESFINLLIFLLAKDDIRKDERLYNNTIRQDIDIRVKTLHLNCNGFISPIDSDDIEFKELHTLMNNRNNFLHGNVNPLMLKFDDVYFDGTIPLFKDDKRILIRTMINSIRYVEPEEAVKDVQIVRRFIKYILSHLESEARNKLILVMNDPQPGYDEVSKHVGVLFSTIIEAI